MTLRSFRSHRFFPAYVCLISLFLLLSMAAYAQSNTSIGGLVKDPQDKVVPGATVTLTNVANGVVRTQQSSSTGQYLFDLLKPGDYKIEAQAAGFRKTILENVHALIGKPVDLDLKLQVGGSAEEITVAAEGAQALVNTQDASVGNNFISQQITQLPLEARNVLSLVTLQPGVTKDGYVAGARADQSNVTLDGVDINEAQSSMIGDQSRDYVNGTSTPNAEKGPVLRLNSEAVEEFRVGTTTTNATGGRSSGAQIALVTKSGSNNWHGAAFESHRNTIFTANDYFNNASGTPRPTLIRNTFGGAIGGPIVKNKAFFFYSYEGRRDASQQSVSNIVPLPNVGQGTVRFHTCVVQSDGSCPKGAISQVNIAELNQIFPDLGGLNPAAQQALAQASAQYPANDTSIGDSLNTNGYRFNSSVPISLNSMAAKLDFNLTSHQTMFVRGNYVFDHYTGAKYLANSPTPSEWDHPLGFAIGHTWTIGNNIVNNARFGLTRQAFSQTGDTVGNYIRFRFLFSPVNASRTLDRVTPVYNWVDDLSWVKGKHTIQFGGTITKQNNIRTNYANAWDDATTNPSFYVTGAIRTPLGNYISQRDSTSGQQVKLYSGDRAAAENAITALIGRFTQYTANFTYDHNNNLLPVGTPTSRDFAGQGYEMYVQDIWKVTPSLTITGGLRYSLWRPIYEVNGFETAPDIQLSEYLARRAASAEAGKPYIDPITILKAGPANGAPSMYNWDKSNFQPRIAVAWSPHKATGIFSRLLGKQGESVLRGGFSLNGDYYGQSLASFFDTNNTLGYGSSTTISANTYDVGCSPYQNSSSGYFGPAGGCSFGKNLGPLFTGFSQDVRSLPGITVVPTISFPQETPLDNSRRIEASLDGALVTPKSYSWSFTYERQLPKGIVVSASYLGRAGRHLLLQRDVMQVLNLKDPSSKTDWYTAGTMLAKLYNQHAGIDANGDFTDPSKIPTIPYFENLFASFGPQWYQNCDSAGNCTAKYPGETATASVYRDLNDEGGDFTTLQSDLDQYSSVGPNAFYNPQYGALTAYSTVGNSNYNALAITVRERLNTFTLDFNYTYSHSLDDASGLQSAISYDGSSFILNPFRQRDNYASSDFDMRHQININSVWQLPFGNGKHWLNNSGKAVNGILGGWQFSNIFRWNTGMPIGFYDAPGAFDDARWATNWEVQSNGVPIKPISTCPTRGAEPKLFGCNTKEAYQSFRNPYPGETGPRNLFRVPGYVTWDFGLGKTFNLSGLSSKIPEGHTLQFRWEVFNATNTQKFGNFDGSRTGFGLSLFPSENDPPGNWSNFTAIQGSPRVMQFTLRYAF